MRSTFLFLLVCVYITGFSQKPKGLFENHEIIEMTIKADFKTIFKEIREERDSAYHKGVVYYKTINNTIDTIKINLKPRGNFRKSPDHCAFSPLFIKFSKKQSKNTPFEGLKKLKLVTHCNNSKKIYEQYVLKEYLVYRTYNVMTDSGFHVRLARITYIDESGKSKDLIKYGFFIENDNQMAERLGGKIIKIKNINQDRTNYKLVNLMAVFLYMVGNPDWSVALLHNIKIVQTTPFELPLAVPYDFDYCGVVNTSYAAPAEVLGIDAVTERIFRGFCRSEEEFQSTFDIFRDKKEEIYNLYKNLEPLNEKSLKWSLNYYDKFYETINNPKKVKDDFLKKCWPNRE
ncbi:MAG: hypothetical protein KAT48_08345 [Bacteroidales bacterium]|nr:hypothetical protein [Bacteroidales bacterium]